MAWAVLLLGSGDEFAAARLAGGPRYRARARQWLREHGLPEHADRLRERARREVFAAHPSELPRLRDRLGVVLTGDSAADVVGLLGEAQAVEFCAPMRDHGAIVTGHALVPGSGNVTVRWVADEVWAALDPDGHVAP